MKEGYSRVCKIIEPDMQERSTCNYCKAQDPEFRSRRKRNKPCGLHEADHQESSDREQERPRDTMGDTPVREDVHAGLSPEQGMENDIQVRKDSADYAKSSKLASQGVCKK